MTQMAAPRNRGGSGSGGFSSNPQSNPAYKARALARREQTQASVPNDRFDPPRNTPLLWKLVGWGQRPDTNNKGEVYADTFFLQHMLADPSSPNFLRTYRTYYRIWPKNPNRKPRTDGKPDTDRMTGWMRAFLGAFAGVKTTENGQPIDLSADELNWEAILNQIVQDCKGTIAYTASVIDLQNTKLDRVTNTRGPASPTPTLANIIMVEGIELGADKAPVDVSSDEDDEATAEAEAAA